MKTLTTKILLLAALLLGLTGVAVAAQDTKDQTVTITFEEIAVLAISEGATLTIEAPAVAGNLPLDQTSTSTTMSWTCNVDAGTTRKITGNIDALFSGIDLYATVAAPGGAGGSSQSEKQFLVAETPYDFVLSIGNTNTSAQTISFRASVTAMVAPDTYIQTVTWTLTDDI